MLNIFNGVKVTGKTFSISLRRLVKYLKVIVHSYEHFLASLQGLMNVHGGCLRPPEAVSCFSALGKLIDLNFPGVDPYYP